MKRFLALAVAASTLLLLVSCSLKKGDSSLTEQYVPQTEVNNQGQTQPPQSEEPVIPRDPFVAQEAHSLIGESAIAYTVGEDRFDIDCDAYLLKNATLDDYNSLLTRLQETTLTKYTDNGNGGIDEACYQTTLSDQSYTVNVTYYSAVKELYMTVEKFRALSPYQIAPTKTVLGTSTTFHMPEQPTVDGSYKFGECEIFRLSNGRFVIVDGGQEFNAEPLSDYLWELSGDKTPVVEAWFLTHAHPDHAYCVWGIGQEYFLVKNIKVQGFYYTWPNNTGMQMEADYSGLLEQVENVNSSLENFRDTYGNVTPRYKLHGGMRFYFNELEVQVLFTQDQIMPGDYGNGFNDSSTSFKFIVHTQGHENTTFLIMGDASSAVCNKLMKMYSSDTLHPTFFQSLHHGSNDCLEFFKYINPDYLNYTHNSEKGKGKPGYNYLHQTCKDVFCAPLVIKIPYVD